MTSSSIGFRRTGSWVLVAFALQACWEDALVEREGLVDAGVDVAADASEGDVALESPPAEAEVEPDAVEPFDFDGDRMLADVTALASVPFEGRMPGSAGGELALQKVEQHFSAMQLQPLGSNGYRMPFTFDLWVQTGPSELRVEDDAWVEREDFGLLGGSGAGEVTSDLVFAGYGLTVPAFDDADYPDCPLPPEGYDDYAGLDVSGKVVLVLRHGPAGDMAVHQSCPANEAAKTSSEALWTFGYKAANAALHGASGLVLINRIGTADSAPVQGGLGEEYSDQAFIAASAHRDKITSVLPQVGGWQASIDSALAPASTETGLTVRLRAATEVQTRSTDNLLASFPGTDPELSQEAIVVGAHIDHLGIDPVTGEVYAGADDNASGTAVIMELARALRAGLIEPRRTIILASFNAEEQGLIGSCRYVTVPAHPMSRTMAMFSVDMVGLGDGQGVILSGAQGQLFSWLTDVTRASAKTDGEIGTVVQGMPLDASDHTCFAMAGVPAVLVSSTGEHATYHTPQDTSDAISPAVLEVSARLTWAGLRALALGEEEALQGDAGLGETRAHATAVATPRPAAARTRW